MRLKSIAIRSAIFAILIVGSIQLFISIDANSHSASDTLRPFIIIATPLWVLGIIASRWLAKWRRVE